MERKKEKVKYGKAHEAAEMKHIDALEKMHEKMKRKVSKGKGKRK